MTKLLHTVTMRKTTASTRRPGRTRVAGRLGALAVLLAGSMALAASGSPAAAAASLNWTSYLFNNDHSSYNSAATSIGTGNLDNLQPVWRWMPASGPGDFFWASPTVFNGVVYIGEENGHFTR